MPPSLKRSASTCCALCLRWNFPSASAGFEQAQVTAGGIPADEIYPHSLESRLADDLYIIGETLDVDGRCGGYNLHFAWATGLIAGRCAARES